MSFNTPPVLHNEKGDVRTAGFELEFANVDIEESTRIIQDLYGGDLKKEHRFHHKVVNTSIGDFTVEIDLALLNEKGYKKPLDKLNINLNEVAWGDNTLEFEVENALENIARSLIPYEIVTPPLPITELDKFEKLRKTLFQHRAEGTTSFLTNAFATHINIETPSTDPQTIVKYIKAFLLLYPWMFKEMQIDMARRVSTFIAPFPTRYAELVISPSYKPNEDSLIDDYHLHNPDRNRPLDMYPLFAHMRAEKVNNYENIGNVKSRPTFHYRLPNSLISQEDWSLSKEWNYWVLIEELANDEERLLDMSKDYMKLRQTTLIGFDGKWSKTTEQWL